MVPAGTVTATSCATSELLGVSATILVGETTTKLVAGIPPKVTLVAPVNCVPVMVIGVPPLLGPTDGLIEKSV